MSDVDIALVTPSYAYDFERCRILVESVERFLPAHVKHYLFVNHADRELFRPLQSSRTLLVAAEDALPKGFHYDANANTWTFGPDSVPVGGWLVQQIVKLGCTATLAEPVLVMCDSDVTLIRDVDPAIFARDDKVRLYRRIGGIGPSMLEHAAWHRNACALLGVEPDPPPMTDYIGMLISWDRALVLRMLDRVEQVTEGRWFEQIVRIRQFSEYILYGVYADKVLQGEGRFVADERRLCLTHWQPEPIDASLLESFIGSMEDDDVGVMITARLDMDAGLRRAINQAATLRARSTPPVRSAL
ncbi:MAG TPA: DUF6492 family protein [Candidatus Acidoferrales bacterium]|jgi:hypothetical protein|nr:DUF6492 family protein [Candidatus Acidoferrales bacterium]